MQDLKDKVAVVTGGAGGIGLSMARAFAAEGMKLVIGDIEKDALEQCAEDFRKDGTEVLAMVTDVTDADAVAGLADATYDTFGAAHVLCNNAGIGHSAPIHELKLADWKWVLDVNLNGVIYGIHSFLPRMRAGGEPCHIVNTASMAGLVAMAGMGPYTASKYAVVAISETLAQECEGTQIGVSVLCPAWVRSRIYDSDRYGRDRSAMAAPNPDNDAMRDQIRGLVESGLSPDFVAGRVVDAIRSNRLYILTHPELGDAMQARFDAIMTSNPA